MNTIIRHIQYLIGRHDCVVVPGWGAFVAAWQCASVDKDSFVMYPPTRTLRFNAEISHNDGLLAASITRREGISYDAASALVAEEVDALRHQLTADGEVAMGRVGRFTLAEDGRTPVFHPVDGSAVTADLRLLRPIEAMPIMEIVRRRAAAEGVDVKEVEAPSNSNYRIVTFGKRFVRIAASIALLLGIGLTVSTPISVQDAPAYNASMSVNVTKPVTKSQAKPIRKVDFNTPVKKAPVVAPVAAPESPAKADDAKSLEPFALPDTKAEPVQKNVNDGRIKKNVLKEKPADMKNQMLPGKVVNPSQMNVKPKGAVNVEPATKDAEPTSNMPTVRDDDAYIMVVASLPTEARAQQFITAQGGIGEFRYECMDGHYRVYIATGPTAAAARKALPAELGKRYPGAWPCKRY